MEYEILEADENVTRKITEIEQTSSRHFDLVAALEFQLVRDPVSYSTRVPGLQSQVYAAWTNSGFSELPRLFFWYVIEGSRIVIYDAWLIKEEVEE